MKKSSLVFLVLFIGSVFVPAFSQEQTASGLFDRGLSAESAEKWYEASQFYMEAIQKNPVYSDAWYHLAMCSYQLGEFDLVLTQLDEAEKYSRDANEIANLRGMTYIAMGDFSKARELFTQILLRMPKDVNARFGLAELDLFDGKITGAEKQYTEALKRQGENRKALLSMALVSAHLGKKDNARRCINQALQLYSDESEVHYLAAIIESMQGEVKKAEKHCRIAVEVDGNNERAYELLAKLRYVQGDFSDVIDFCDFIIGRDRDNSIAWYLKGTALLAQNKPEEAINIWSAGLNINPQDEIMRAALEVLVAKTVPLEDSRRKEWAKFHVMNAREYSRRYDSLGITYEYQRALKLDPTDSEARMNFAGMLELNGLHENYLDQLVFVQQNRETSESENRAFQTAMSDTIEAYENLLQDSLAKKWNVQPFFLEKNRWSLGIYYLPSSVDQFHVENNRIAADFACDMFASPVTSAVSTQVASVSGFGDAYQRARSGKKDYFIILSMDEGSRDITLEYTMYSARTGSKVKENSLYSTGNNKNSTVFRSFRSEILGCLPVRANIINRDGKIILADIGRSENICDGAVFDIVRKNSIETASSGSGVTYKDSDVLGSFTVTTAGEEVSEGLLEYRGFYDRINTGDELVLISIPERAEDVAAGSEGSEEGKIPGVPGADANGTSLYSKAGLTAEDLGVRRTSSFIDLIRSIY